MRPIFINAEYFFHSICDLQWQHFDQTFELRPIFINAEYFFHSICDLQWQHFDQTFELRPIVINAEYFFHNICDRWQHFDQVRMNLLAFSLEGTNSVYNSERISDYIAAALFLYSLNWAEGLLVPQQQDTIGKTKTLKIVNSQRQLVWETVWKTKQTYIHTWMKWATSWENLFMPYANNKGADQPAHPRSLINSFVVRCLDSIIPLVSLSEISSL